MTKYKITIETTQKNQPTTFHEEVVESFRPPVSGEANHLLVNPPIQEMVVSVNIIDSDYLDKSIPIIKSLMNEMTEEQRWEILSNGCGHCGSSNPECQCWNDD